MMYLLIVIVLAVVAFLAFRSMGSKNSSPTETQTRLPSAAPEMAQPTQPVVTPSQPADQYRAEPSSTRPAVEQPTLQNPLSNYRPVGTPRLDDPDAVRPELDKEVLMTARAIVPPIVPESVMADALLDTTPEQMKNLLSRAPESVVREAFGSRDNVQPAHYKAEDLSQLKGMGDALDDLDIWSFGEKN